jgi:transposase
MVFLIKTKESQMSRKKSDAPASAPKRTRKKIDDALKVKIVLEAIKETMTLNELAAKYEVHPNQIVTWKKKFLERSVDVFTGSGQEREELDRLRREKERLVHQIGEQAVDIEFLKKNLRKLNLL